MSLRIRKYIGATPFFRPAVTNGAARAGHGAAYTISRPDSAIWRRPPLSCLTYRTD